ncbi:metallophosphoesterase [Sphingopyxis sp.]|uniref:metallophosphoesterase n=1 Tax=Sphingopyxis sp. TaxID=1908224 RepID=UPI002B4A6A08|nr:metallophosphoesterase [Sphingopyxis sp.]HJS11088.1 metallophosphoesterase [Sphingopyxis sp.]
MGIFSRFRKREVSPEVEPAVPPGLLVYAIGDIHGRDDLFADLLGRIEADRERRTYDICILILLGDLVDRGPSSDRVVERAITLSSRFDRVHHLIGNHEECMLAALTGDVRALRYFYRIGGESTIRSYLKNDDMLAQLPFEELAKAFPAAVPQSHVDYLGRGEDMIRYGDYVFVHAGVRPGTPLDRQKTSDLRWIRDEFLSDTSDHGVMVVHGHTISDDVDRGCNRIGIDTGAYASGCLTAIVLQGHIQGFLSTRDK